MWHSRGKPLTVPFKPKGFNQQNVKDEYSPGMYLGKFETTTYSWNWLERGKTVS